MELAALFIMVEEGDMARLVGAGDAVLRKEAQRLLHVAAERNRGGFILAAVDQIEQPVHVEVGGRGLGTDALRV